MNDEFQSLLVTLFVQAKLIDCQSINFFARSNGAPTEVHFTLRNKQVTRIQSIENKDTYRLFQFVVQKLNKHAPANFQMNTNYHDIYIPHAVISPEFDIHGVMANIGGGNVVLSLTRGLSNNEKTKIEEASKEMKKSAEQYGFDIKEI